MMDWILVNEAITVLDALFNQQDAMTVQQYRQLSEDFDVDMTS